MSCSWCRYECPCRERHSKERLCLECEHARDAEPFDAAGVIAAVLRSVKNDLHAAKSRQRHEARQFFRTFMPAAWARINREDKQNELEHKKRLLQEEIAVAVDRITHGAA